MKKLSKEFGKTIIISISLYLVILTFFLIYMTSFISKEKEISLDIVNIIFLVVPVLFTFTMENYYKHQRLKNNLPIIESEEVDIKYYNGLMAVLLCLVYLLIYIFLNILKNGFEYLTPFAYTFILIALQYKVLDFLMYLNEMIDKNL